MTVRGWHSVMTNCTIHEQIRTDQSQVVHYSAARFPVADTYLTQFFHSDSIIGKETAKNMRVIKLPTLIKSPTE